MLWSCKPHLSNDFRFKKLEVKKIVSFDVLFIYFFLLVSNLNFLTTCYVIFQQFGFDKRHVFCYIVASKYIVCEVGNDFPNKERLIVIFFVRNADAQKSKDASLKKVMTKCAKIIKQDLAHFNTAQWSIVKKKSLMSLGFN